MQVRKYPLVLRELHRQRVFENRAMGKIFGFKRHGEIDDWKKFHNE
jgi:hypothetical protein